MSTYIIVHGAWHDGSLFEATAAPLREMGHEVHLPTIAGNGDGDSKETGLDQAIDSIAEFIETNDLNDFVLVGHSYGGMIITGIADRMPDRIQRLVYWNAFVPNNGESLNDMVHLTMSNCSIPWRERMAARCCLSPFGAMRLSMTRRWRSRRPPSSN